MENYEQVKQIFKKNFTKLSDCKLIDLNEATLKIMASYEDANGGFYEPELIYDAFNGKSDDEAITSMFESITNDELEVEYKNKNDDYVITAGNNEVVYVLKLQIIRIK